MIKNILPIATYTGIMNIVVVIMVMKKKIFLSLNINF